MKATAIIERNETGLYSIYMETNNLEFGLNGQGKTVDEAKKEFLDAYAEIKELLKAEIKDVPELEFEYQYDMASFLDYYSRVLSLAGIERLTGVNQGQLSHYLTGRSKPSKKTAEKIETSIRSFGQEMSKLEFI